MVRLQVGSQDVLAIHTIMHLYELSHPTQRFNQLYSKSEAEMLSNRILLPGWAVLSSMSD